MVCHQLAASLIYRSWMPRGLLTNMSQVKIMQYTGLKDKNGREIYEGDIVCRESGLLGDEYDEFTGIVKFIMAAFVIENFDGKDGTYLGDDVAELEVLGNIYDGPELIKESECLDKSM